MVDRHVAVTRHTADDPLSDFHVRIATHHGTPRRVHSIGEGPAVIIIAEMPGISPAVADFARRVAGIGATAVMPSIYGVDGQDPVAAADPVVDGLGQGDRGAGDAVEQDQGGGVVGPRDDARQ